MAIPITKFVQFGISQVDPSGSRHLTSASAFVKELDTTIDGALDFGDISVDVKTEGPTRAVVFRVSDLQGNTKIQNMRFWAPSLPQPAGTLSFNMAMTPDWIVNNRIVQASGQVPTSLPSSQNLFRGNAAGYQEGHHAMSGVDDNEVSEYIYLNVTTNPDVTSGRYGAGGSGDWRYRVTYDFI